jgi:hypothetical protein
VTAVPFRALLAPQQRAWEFGATIFVAFAALALVLAAVGLYSVRAYGVAQRTRELGVRIALGASTAAVVRLVVRQGAIFALAGIAIGGAAALLASRSIDDGSRSRAENEPAAKGSGVSPPSGRAPPSSPHPHSADDRPRRQKQRTLAVQTTSGSV